jgi:serine protease AprX
MVEYAYLGGTSMVAPHIAKIVTLLMAVHPDALISDIIQAMKDTAKHPRGNPYFPDNRWGYGMVQPVEALKAL